jgi:hypothetical protein
MSAIVEASQIVTKGVSPHLTAARLSLFMATPLENMTMAQFIELCDALTRSPGSTDPARTIGSLLI